MMNRLLTTLLLAMTSLLLVACTGVSGNGNLTTEIIDVDDFSSVSLAGIGDLVITQNDTASLSITTDENLQQYIEVNVNGDTLEIGTEEGVMINSSTEMRYNIAAAQLDEVTLDGAGTITISDYDAEELDVTVNGAGDFELDNLTVDTLRLTISGAGEANASGTATDFNATINGAGDINAFDLEADNVNVSINGAGDANVTANERLTGSINGAGGVTYRGEPETVNVNEGTIGSVTSDN